MVRKEQVMKKYIDKDGNPWNGCYIVVDGQTIVNPTENMLLENGYTEVKEPDPTPDELFEKRKQAKIAEIDVYDKSPNVNLFYVYEQPMWLDFDERSRILTSISAYRKMGRTEMKKIYGENTFVLPLETWEEMLAAVEIYASECLNVTEQHKILAHFAHNDDDLDAIDITEGYPEKLTFKPYGELEPDIPENSEEGGE